MSTIAFAEDGISFDDLYGKLGDIFLDEEVLWVHLAGLKTSELAEEYELDGKPLYRLTKIGKDFVAMHYALGEDDDSLPPLEQYLDENSPSKEKYLSENR